MGNSKPSKKVQSPQESLMIIDSFNQKHKEPQRTLQLKQSPLKSHLMLNIDNINLYSILDLSHQITLENMTKNQFDYNESLYTSTYFYVNTDKEFQNRSKSFYYKNGNINLLNSSIYKTSISMYDESENCDVVKHKIYGPSIKKYSSCEDLNNIIKKGKLRKGSSVVRNESEITIGLLDDKTSIGKEYKESIAIQEENENIGYDYVNYNDPQLFKTNVHSALLSLNKSNKLQKSISKAEGAKKALAYSNTIRNQFVRYPIDKTRLMNDQSSIDGIERDRNQTLPHEKSIRNFFLENMCDIKEEPEKSVNDTRKNNFMINMQNDTFTQRYQKQNQNQDKPYKIDLKSIEKTSRQKCNTSRNKTILYQLLESKSSNRKPKAKNIHKRFISVLEDLMEVNPNNRANVIKKKLNKERQRNQYNNNIDRDQYEDSQNDNSTPPDYLSYKQDNDIDMAEYCSTQKSDIHVQDYPKVFTYESTEPSPKPKLKKYPLYLNKR